MSVALTPSSVLAIPELSVVPQGDDFVVGNAPSGVFICVPEVGVVALQELQRGARITDAGRVASAHAGQDVDVLEFAETLVECGLVSAVDGVSLAAEPTSPSNAPQRVASLALRAFFSLPALAVYASLLLASAGTFVARPTDWPSYEDLFFVHDAAVAVATATIVGFLLAGCHELCHWSAAHAAGVGARLRVSRRLFLIVLETDLSQLWSLPRRSRLVPLLAGMAFDSAVLASCLALRVLAETGVLPLPGLLYRFLGTVVLLAVTMLVFQFLIFLRTDLYAVLVTACGCINLWRVKTLYLKRLVGRLAPSERAELADAHPRDLKVAPWFAAVYVVGLGWATWFFIWIFIPGTVYFGGWMLFSLFRVSFGSSRFWEALVLALICAVRVAVPLVVFARERSLARRPRALQLARGQSEGP